MGNCTTCVHRSNRHIFPNRFRTFSPYNLNSLIDETLAIIRTVVDTDQEPPHAMLVVSRIASREDRWIDVMTALIERIPMSDSLGATVIALLLDECSLPSRELLNQLIKRICSDNQTRMETLRTIVDNYIQANQVEQPDNHDLHCERNTLVLLGCLAEKLVGPTSAAMLNTIALEFIIDRVYLGIYRYTEITSLDFENRNYSCVLKIILFALIAIEKFSHSLESKHILFQSLTIPNQQDKLNVLQYYEPWATSNNCLKRQIGFYAQWLLDNVFILESRRSTYETIDHQSINVMLNDKDVSEYLKIGPDGLEARSDTVSFESVRCTFNVNSDVWYYEVLIVTDGVMQIGWATKQSKFMNHEGYGIGDDQYSIAYDGCRNLIWYGAKSIPHSNPAWKSGDIVGCLIDFNRREVIFSLNGHCLEPFRKLFSHICGPIVDGYFAAASFMSYQHCRFNFGSQPFRYPPKTVAFTSFNQYGYLNNEDKFILPKYKKLELLRAIEINDSDCILCVDNRANILLRPCQHTGFCEQCALKLDLCPICRSEIHERTVHLSI